MLGFAVKLTETPAATSDADVDSLREAGFSDRDILDIVEVVAYYAYIPSESTRAGCHQLRGQRVARGRFASGRSTAATPRRCGRR